MTNLAKHVKDEVAAIEADAKTGAVKLFDAEKVDIREQLPALMSKLGVNTSDDHGVFHAVLTLLITLLEEYGPTEVKEILGVAS